MNFEKIAIDLNSNQFSPEIIAYLEGLKNKINNQIRELSLHAREIREEIAQRMAQKEFEDDFFTKSLGGLKLDHDIQRENEIRGQLDDVCKEIVRLGKNLTHIDAVLAQYKS